MSKDKRKNCIFKDVAMIMATHSLSDLEALDVLEIMGNNAIGEDEAVARYMLAEKQNRIEEQDREEILAMTQTCYLTFKN